MKKFILLFTIILISTITFCQTTATNFEVANCDGQMYSLFDDLDQGNVVVIAWVMPCVSCIQHPLEAFQIVQGYDQDKVKFLMVDDYADHDCSVIQTWSENYQMGSSTKFVNTAITMSDYGIDGMPKIVVLGCNSHKVFYNKNSSSTGVKEAIDEAIAECSNTTINESIDFNSKLTVFPNPTSQSVCASIENHTALSTLSIINLLGKEVLRVNQYIFKKSIDVSLLPDGIYLTKIISDNKIYSKPLVVKR